MKPRLSFMLLKIMNKKFVLAAIAAIFVADRPNQFIHQPLRT